MAQLLIPSVELDMRLMVQFCAIDGRLTFTLWALFTDHTSLEKTWGSAACSGAQQHYVTNLEGIVSSTLPYVNRFFSYLPFDQESLQ